jgi:hypothetical protein
MPLKGKEAKKRFREGLHGVITVSTEAALSHYKNINIAKAVSMKPQLLLPRSH